MIISAVLVSSYVSVMEVVTFKLACQFGKEGGRSKHHPPITEHLHFIVSCITELKQLSIHRYQECNKVSGPFTFSLPIVYHFT